jgi:hypothetical protein
MNFLRRWSLAIVLVLLCGLSLPAQTVSILSTKGAATIQLPSDTAPRAAAVGLAVVAGTRIVTGPDGRVILTPIPGVKTIIAASSDITLEVASVENVLSTNTALARASLRVKQGSVTSDLQKNEAVALEYNVTTPRGVAGARGTLFTVLVTPEGHEVISVAHGNVIVNFNDGTSVTLLPGQLTVARVGDSIQQVNGVASLATEDRALAQAASDLTLAALIAAVEAGVEIRPTALAEAVAAAESLGLTITDEQRAAVAAAEATLKLSTEGPAQTLQEQLAIILGSSSTAGPGDGASNENTEVVTENTAGGDTGGGPGVTPTARADFLALLSPAEVAAFDSLPLADQDELIADFFALGQNSNTAGLLRAFALNPQQAPADVTSVLGYAPAEQQVFFGFAAPYQNLVLTDAAFRAYTFAPNRSAAEVTFVGDLTATERTTFLDPTRAALQDSIFTADATGDDDLVAFGLDAANSTADVQFFTPLAPSQRVAFAALDAPRRDFLKANPNNFNLTTYALTPLISAPGQYPPLTNLVYYTGLLPSAQTAYTSLSSDSLRDQFAILDEPALTTYALEGAPRPLASLNFVLGLSVAQRDRLLVGIGANDVPTRDLIITQNNTLYTAFALNPNTPGGTDFNPPTQITYLINLGDPTQAQQFATGLTLAERTDFLADLAALNSDPVATSGLRDYVLDPATSLADRSTVLGFSTAEQTTFFGIGANYQALIISDAQFRTFANAAGRTAGDITLVGDFAANQLDRYTNFFAAGRESLQPLILAANTAGDTQFLSFALDNDSTSGLPNPTAQVVFLGNLLDAGQRTRFVTTLDATQRALLVADNTPGTSAFALDAARTPAQLAYLFDATVLPEATARLAFVNASAPIQSVLFGYPGDADLANFALFDQDAQGNPLAHSAAVVSQYAALSVDRLTYRARPASQQEFAATSGDPAFLSRFLNPSFSDVINQHYIDITDLAARAQYDAQALDIQDQFATLAQPTLSAKILLTPSATLEPQKLRANLGALSALPPLDRDFYLNLAGQNLIGSEQWSHFFALPPSAELTGDAVARSRVVFAGLTPTQQAYVVNYGLGAQTFDLGADYLNGVIAYHESLPAAQQNLLRDAGWGEFVDEFANNPSLATDDLSTLNASYGGNPAYLATLKQFGVSPEAALVDANFLGEDGPTRLDAYLALSPNDRQVIDRLLSADGSALFRADFTNTSSSDRLDSALAFLTTNSDPGLLTALERLCAGSALILADATQNIPSPPSGVTTVGDRLLAIYSDYVTLSNPDLQAALAESGLFRRVDILQITYGFTEMQTVATAWDNLSPATRDFLLFQGRDLNLELTLLGANNGVGYTLTEIDTVFSALSPTQRGILVDLQYAAVLYGTGPDLGLLTTSDLQTRLSTFFSSTLFNASNRAGTIRIANELRIAGRDDRSYLGLFFASSQGLFKLIESYGSLPTDVRLEAQEFFSENGFNTFTGKSHFISRDLGNTPNLGDFDYYTQNVSFVAPADQNLYVGAVRRLAIQGQNSSTPTFNVTGSSPTLGVQLYASDLIDLDSVSFSTDARNITMQAVTINLANVNFNAGTSVILRSSAGGTGTNNLYPTFGSAQAQIGRVNFLSSVSYGSTNNVMLDEPTFDTFSSGNIQIRSFANP